MAGPRRPERDGAGRGSGSRFPRGSRTRPAGAARTSSVSAEAYVAGLTLLAGRDLSATQLGERLRRRGFTTEATDTAVSRLRREGALDDHRAAAAYARRAVEVRRKGPARIERELAARGVDAPVARAAIAEALEGRDLEELLDRSLARRLAGPITDRAEFRRLYQYLLRQGFDGHMAAAALRRRAQSGAAPDDSPPGTPDTVEE